MALAPSKRKGGVFDDSSSESSCGKDMKLLKKDMAKRKASTKVEKKPKKDQKSKSKGKK